MSKPLASAAAHPRKAKDHRAETTYKSAQFLHEALESSQKTRALSDAQHTQLCGPCRAIPIAKNLKQHPTSKPRRRKVGDLLHAVKNQTSCMFCKFLVESLKIGCENRSDQLHAKLTTQCTEIYFAPDSDGKAWYSKAGIDTSLPACPFVWLQTGPPTVTGQPHICVSCEPFYDIDENAGRSNKRVYPRPKGALEAFNGCMNYNLVKSWLGKCRAEHGAECHMEDTLSTLSLDIYLIDVHTSSFVRRRAGDRFVALSYVWGQRSRRTLSVSSTHKSTSADKEAQNQTKSEFVQELPAFIPQTMVDAITFVECIGERYLWIDQLCIDQTNDEEKQRQINSMDRIFESAYLTVVNLDGQETDWGLPGISIPLQQVQQPTFRLDSGRLMATFIYSNWDNNGSSVWDSRGWTLQERLLSRRCVVFAKTNISMTCRTEFFHDCLAINLESKGVRSWLGDDYFREDGSGINLDDTKWDFKNYDALVSVFSGRKLTHEADALNACRGSLNRLSQTASTEFCFGLPVHDFLRALIWVPHFAHALTRRLGFPSWSWTGWTGRIEYAYWVGDMAAYLKEDSDEQTHEYGPSLKRTRIQPHETKITHPERARVISHPTKESPIPLLQLETTVAKFKLHLVRRDRELHRNLKPTSQQSKKAIGDHWTLIGQDGRVLRDVAGEYPRFELTDSFFRLKPEYSQLLLKQDNEAEFVFVEHWPRIRDSTTSNKWLYDTVSALDVVRNLDDTAWRLASVLLKGEEWYAKNPRPEIISLF